MEKRNILYIINSKIKALGQYVFVLTILFSFLSANAQVNLTEEEQDWVKTHPLLTATNEMDWAPIDFVRDGREAGFSVDYLNLVASKVGLEIQFVNGHSWGELIELLKSRKIDIAQSITETDERSEFLDFTRPYLDIPKVYYGRVGSDRIKTIKDLKGKKIGLVSSWSSSEIFRTKYPEFEIVAYDSVKDVLIGLASGEVDLFSERLPVANYIISENLISGLEVVGRELLMEDQNYLRIASRSDWPTLNQILEKGMDAVSPKEFREISERWNNDFAAKETINLNAEELEWISKHKVVKVVVDNTMAPYEFIDENGEIAGIAGGYYKKISEKIGIKFEWVGNKNWQEAFAALDSGQAYVVSGSVYTSERAKVYHFTDPYMHSTSAIFTRKDFGFIGNMENLKGRKIAQEKGFATTEKIRRDFPNIEIIDVNSSVEALKLVSSGVADAYVGDIPTTAYHIATGNMPQIIVAGETPYVSDTGMAISLDQPILASVMRKAMSSISEVERNAIASRWLALKIDEQVNTKLIAKLTAGALFAILIISMWALSLRREIKRREKLEVRLLKAQKEAEQANKAKSQFLSNMSHEIRTPLNAIIGFSEIMTQNVFGEINPPKYQEYVGDIESSGRHLATVINNILDLSKIEAGKWHLNEVNFDLDYCISSSIKMVETMAKSKNVRLFYKEISKDAVFDVFGDETAIKRMLINLLSNAIKFTESGGFVTCSISVNDKGDAELRIRDTGIGIPEDKIDHVLSPFGQDIDAQIMVKSEAGTGLGLSIVKQLIDMHDGEFKLESEVGVGTSATIVIPKNRIIEVKRIKCPQNSKILRTA